NTPENKKKNEEGAAFVLAFISTIVAGIALYSLGSSIAAYQDASQELEDTQEFKQTLSEQQLYRGIPPDLQNHIGEAAQAVKLKDRICSRIKNSAIGDIILRTALLGSASAALSGAGIVLTGAAVASTTASSLMTGGIIAGLITTGGILFKLGFDNTDKANLR